MPLKVRPGTPSILFGRRSPCQWIEVGSLRRLATLIVTVSPSRNRRIGAGTELLTAVAVRALPVTLIGREPIERSKLFPVRVAGPDAAKAFPRGQPCDAMSPAAAIPSTKRRRLRENGGLR